MIVSVTPLGDSSGAMNPLQVGERIAAYLEGVGLAKAGRHPGPRLELPSLTGSGTVAYYADSTGIRPGRWLGAREGEVSSEVLVALLAGVDPETGEEIESVPQSARGRRRSADRSALRQGVEWLKTTDAAAAIGVRDSYLQRLAKGAERDLAQAAAGEDAPQRSGVRAVVLEALRTGRITKGADGALRWHRDVAVELAVARRPATSVVAYDVTFSVPKDVSVIWARGDEDVRANVLAAIDEAIAAGVRYLERNALQVRVGKTEAPAKGWLAADYLHLTSRALEPQLHHHLVLLNRASDAEGNVRALDGRLLFAHAKTAGYVAAAELRHQLAARLGLAHGGVAKGIAPVLGIPRAVTEEFSTRRREINEATAALGAHSAAARQVAAYDTRSAKEAGFDFDEVTAWWGARMDALGFPEHALSEVLWRVDGPGLVTDRQLEALFSRLLRVSGITESEARFDRRTVVQAIASFAGERLSGRAIEDLADRFLSLDEVVALESGRDTSSANVIRLGDGRVVSVPTTGYFTTRSQLVLEERAMSLYLSGRDAGLGVVPAEILEQVLACERFARLSEEQRQFVAALTTSGHRVQGAVGRAGSGKTTSIEAAVAAWRAAGYVVLGSAVGGSQTVILAEEATGEARTVASVLARHFDLADPSLITDHTVLLVDEASLLSTREVALLERAVGEHPGAILRLVGDQDQHSSVAAGGFFRWLVEEHRADVPELRTLYRQAGAEQAEVRLALEEYRAGMITEAMARLERDGRIAEAETFDEACDLICAAWYAERERRAADPGRRVSSMTADHHHERRELNARARAMFKADGTLSGPELVVGGIGFQVCDEVIARVGDHDLRAEGAERSAWVRNGSRGTVREVGEDHLVVEFERWGMVNVPVSYIEREVVPGVRGGLMHSYALTTHAAQGSTMAAAMPLLTDASSAEGAYVALTRHQLHLNAVAIRYDKLVPRVVDDPLPVARGELSDLAATARALERAGRERLASQTDPDARRINKLATAHGLPELLDRPASGTEDQALYERAARERIRTITLRAVLDPAPEVLEHLGARPEGAEVRAAWDTAVGAIAVYRELRSVEADPEGGGLTWALGERPVDPAAASEYDEFAGHIGPLVDAQSAEAGGADGGEAVEAEGRVPTGSAERHAAGAGEAELVERARRVRAARDEQMRNLEDLGRSIELQLYLAEPGRADGQLEASYRRYDGVEARYDELARQFADMEAELDERGIEAPGEHEGAPRPGWREHAAVQVETLTAVAGREMGIEP